MNLDIEHLRRMAHSPVRNYIIPGLTSSLIGSPGPSGTVRLFECSRAHQEQIVPHSHRFDFQCQVLRGYVTNKVWTKNETGDLHEISALGYVGAIGKHTKSRLGTGRFTVQRTNYGPGETYAMKHEQVHSIEFARGAVVLFLEGPTLTDKSVVIEPIVDDEVVPTFKVEPWMFKGKLA